MSRGREIEIDGRREAPPARGRGLGREGRERQQRRVLVWQLDRERIRVERELPERDIRDSVRVRGKQYRLRQSGLDSLREIGRFCIVDEQDLHRFGYAGNSVRMREDLRSLREQGLVERRDVEAEDGDRLRLLMLTDEGREAVEELEPPGSRQRYHAGLVKPAEVEHDAALFRVYRQEAERIENEGGSVRRVVLNYELKSEVYSRLAELRKQPESQWEEGREAIARSANLQVVNRKIPLPDLRIEYETRDGDVARADVELATGHYRSTQVAEKARAGFRFYMPAAGGSSGGSAVREEREITASILSL